jgi:hypothetical protein
MQGALSPAYLHPAFQTPELRAVGELPGLRPQNKKLFMPYAVWARKKVLHCRLGVHSSAY